MRGTNAETSDDACERRERVQRDDIDRGYLEGVDGSPQHATTRTDAWRMMMRIVDTMARVKLRHDVEKEVRSTEAPSMRTTRHGLCVA